MTQTVRLKKKSLWLLVVPPVLATLAFSTLLYEPAQKLSEQGAQSFEVAEKARPKDKQTISLAPAESQAIPSIKSLPEVKAPSQAAIKKPAKKSAKALTQNPKTDKVEDLKDRPELEAQKANKVLATGRVLDPSGQILKGCQVEVHRRKPRFRKTQGCDRQGRFAIALEPGEYLLRAQAEGFLKGSWKRVKLPDQSEFPVGTLKLRLASEITGRVRDHLGDPVAEATVTAGRRSSQTDEQGRFVIGMLEQGLYNVTALSPGYQKQVQRRIPTSATRPGQADFQLKQGGSLSGLVVDIEGKPEAKIRVRVYKKGRRLDETRTGRDGRFLFDYLPVGPLTVVALRRKSKGVVQKLVSIAADQTAELELSLQEPAVLSGRLTTPGGRPWVKKRIVAQLIGGDLRREVRSDDRGEFRIDRLWPGRYQVTAWQGRVGRTPRVSRTVNVVDDSARLTLVLEEGLEIAGRVVNAEGQAVTGVWVFAMIGARYHSSLRVDKQGQFRIRHLKPGGYEIVVRHGRDQFVGRKSVTLPEDQSLEQVVVEVFRPGRLKARVVTSQGQPLAGLRVTVRGKGHLASVRRRGTTKGDGRVELGPLYDGQYSVSLDEDKRIYVAHQLGYEAIDFTARSFTLRDGVDQEMELVVTVR